MGVSGAACAALSCGRGLPDPCGDRAVAQRVAWTPAADLVLLDADEPDGYVRNWAPPGFPPLRHIGYAVQWFGLALALAVIYVVTNFRRASETGMTERVSAHDRPPTPHLDRRGADVFRAPRRCPSICTTGNYWHPGGRVNAGELIEPRAAAAGAALAVGACREAPSAANRSAVPQGQVDFSVCAARPLRR